jgi:hypothetical protein
MHARSVYPFFMNIKMQKTYPIITGINHCSCTFSTKPSQQVKLSRFNTNDGQTTGKGQIKRTAEIKGQTRIPINKDSN